VAREDPTERTSGGGGHYLPGAGSQASVQTLVRRLRYGATSVAISLTVALKSSANTGGFVPE
jgi:hypothetical protein